MSEQPFRMTAPGDHEGPYDWRIDVIRTTYVGKHREPELVVDIAEARQKRRQRKEKKP